MKVKIKLYFFKQDKKGVKSCPDTLTEVEATFISEYIYKGKETKETFVNYSFVHPITGKITESSMTKHGWEVYKRK